MDEQQTILVRDLQPGMKCIREDDGQPLKVELVKPWPGGWVWIEWKNDRDGSGAYYGNDQVVLAQGAR